MILLRFLCILIGYAFGLIQTPYLIGRLHHVDIRKMGSGNAGSTNVLRTFGTKAGLLALFVDALKCFVAVVLVGRLVRESGGQILPLLKMYAAAGCILGHNYPFYLGFKGGKGVAASLGMTLAIDWRVCAIHMIVFFIIFFTTHYVSLASLAAYLTGFTLIVVFGALGFYGMAFWPTVEMDIIMTLLTIQAVTKHKNNIRRLMDGTERKTYMGK